MSTQTKINIDDSNGILTNEVYVRMASTILDMGGEITFENITKVIINTMVAVELYKTLPGAEKKDVVIKVVSCLIIDYCKNEEIRIPLVAFVNSVMPSLIDEIITIDTGTQQFKIKPNISKLLGSCC